MSRERILVTLQGSDADQTALEAARKLAPFFEADIRGLFVEPDPASYLMWAGPGAAGASVVSSAVEAVREESDKACESAQAHFKSSLGDVSGNQFKRVSDTASDAAEQARLVRLLVTCPDAVAKGGTLAGFTTSCLVDEACPVYVPRGGAIEPKSIAIAWDGSKEAARAAFAASPLLNEGDEVIVLHSPRNLDFHDRRAAAPNRLQHWLEARKITTQSQEIDAAGNLGEALLEASSSVDLLVAGAYGQSRIAQFMFGSVTRTLLQAQDGPSLLLAH